MKRILILSIILFTCNNYHQLKAQEKLNDSKEKTSWDDIKKSTHQLGKNIRLANKIVKQKSLEKSMEPDDSISYFSDTLYIDLTHEDSARIAAAFYISEMETNPPLHKEKAPTQAGKIIRKLTPSFLRKNKSK